VEASPGTIWALLLHGLVLLQHLLLEGLPLRA
jgi:hypothetical protein